MASKVLFNFLLSLALVLPLLASTDAQGLKIGFYNKACPKVEAIIREEMIKVMKLAPSLAGPLLRLHFHDCFVNGCDGSVLLNSSKTNVAERDAPPNLSLRGFGVIDGIKSRLEKACPQTVSCADIVTLVARDAVYLSKGPTWEVRTGRRDGRRSVALDCLGNLPPPTSNMTMLKGFFAKKGLSAKDIVILSGGHTLGTSHCSSFSDRLYNFTGKGDVDPILDKHYVPKLKNKCKPNDVSTLVEMDPGSFKTFDTSYYKLVAKKRALFTSDMTLLEDNEIKAYVNRQAKASSPFEFFRDFGESMIKMGNIQVLTGNQGEIRKKCAFVN